MAATGRWTSCSARVDVLRARIAFASSRGSQAPPLLLKAARRLGLDPALARETYLEALSAASQRTAWAWSLDRLSLLGISIVAVPGNGLKSCAREGVRGHGYRCRYP
jgi:hypothetical protein